MARSVSIFTRARQPETRALTPDGVRDPRAATQALSYSSPGMRQIPMWDADSAVQEAYMSSVLVYACVRTRAYAFAGCPLRAVLPGKDIADHDPNAPLARLLGPAPGGPNPTFSSRKLWANAITNKIVTGKMAWELEMPQGASASRSDWAPTAIWPLVARYFDVVPTQGGTDLFSYFTYGRGGFNYGGNGQGGQGSKKRLEVSQVFYSYTPSLNDIRQATSPLQASRYDILADVLQAQYDVAFLRNDARPAGIIVHEAFEEANQRRAFEQQFEANHRGPQNANRTAFAEAAGGTGTAGAISWVQIGVTQKDAQMLAMSNAKADRICMALSVPKSLLDASGRTFSNAGMEERNFWLDTMLPDLADMEDEINLMLAPRLGPHIAKFDTRHVTALQPPARFLAIKLDEAVDREIITPAEARSEMGFPGDFPKTTTTMGATMTEQAQLITALSGAGWDAPTIAGILSLTPPAEVQAPEPVVPLLLPPQPSADLSTTWAAGLSLVRSLREVDDRREQRRATWRQADALATAQEAAWVAALKRLFAKQRASTLKRLESRKGRLAKASETRAGDDFNPDDVFDREYWQSETEAAVQGLYETLIAAAGARVAGGIGVPFDITNPAVMAKINYRATLLAERITGTTYDEIRSIILSGIEGGWDMPTIANGIMAVFDAADSKRATLIARTETISASSDGALAAYDQARSIGALDGMGKVWIADDDERTCEDCLALDGEVVGFDETFSDGTDGPPDHAACRCAVGAEQMDTGRGVDPEQARDLLTAIAAGHLRASAFGEYKETA